jgi:hypothetical protein
VRATLKTTQRERERERGERERKTPAIFFLGIGYHVDIKMSEQ